MSSVLTSTAMAICFVAGKSGGHLLPAITQAQHFLKTDPETSVFICTSGSALDHAIMNQHAEIEHIPAPNLENPPYSKPWLFPVFALKTAWIFFKSLYILHQKKPTKVVACGGFICIPVCLAAKLLSIPVEIQELNVEPGRTTQLLAKFFKKIAICFAQTAQYFPNNECIMMDYPVRFTQKDKDIDITQLKNELKLDHHKITVAVFGGSQGSIQLNELFLKMLQENPQLYDAVQIIHQTGQSDTYDYAQWYRQHAIPSVVFTYSSEIYKFYAVADIIISRAGAGTLFEIKFFQKPCICIPHKTAHTNHQVKNVLALQKEYPELFTILEQDNFSAQTLYQAYTDLLSSKIMDM